MIERHGLSFDMLSDPGNEYAALLGLRYVLPDYLRSIYQGFGLDLAKHNGEDSWTLPLPGRLVIDGKGTIRAADTSPDYTHRPEPQKTLDDVTAMLS